MAQDYTGKVKFVAVDVDEASDVAEKYKVQYMPTLVVVKGGEEIARVVGADEDKIRAMIDGAL